MLAGAGIDALNPERTHIALLVAAVTVGVLKRLLHSLSCYSDTILCSPSEPFRQLEYLLLVHFQTVAVAAGEVEVAAGGERGGGDGRRWWRAVNWGGFSVWANESFKNWGREELVQLCSLFETTFNQETTTNPYIESFSEIRLKLKLFFKIGSV